MREIQQIADMDKILLRALCSGVQREEVDVEKKGGVEQERLLVSQLLSCQERACTVGGPHHTNNLGDEAAERRERGRKVPSPRLLWL